MVETIFTHPVFIETILPFLLVFTLVFAILQKTKILGDGKKQIDAIVAFVIGLLFVAFGTATDIVVRMIPVLGIALVVILVFMLLWGSLFKPNEFEMNNGLKIAFGILIGLVVMAAVLILTGGLDYVTDFIYGDTSGIMFNGLLILIIIGAIAVVVMGGKNSGGGSS
jgi:hypothetical protein